MRRETPACVAGLLDVHNEIVDNSAETGSSLNVLR